METKTTLRSRDPLNGKEDRMGRKKQSRPEGAVGPILAHNVKRLGFVDQVIRHADIAELVNTKTKKTMSRQRVAAIFNSVNVSDDTIDTLAKALGVTREYLLTPPSKEAK